MNINYSLPLLENRILEFQFSDGVIATMRTENVAESCGEILLYCRVFNNNEDVFGQSVYVYEIIEYNGVAYCVYSMGTGMGFNILDMHSGESLLNNNYKLIIHVGSNLVELSNGDDSIYFNLTHKMAIDINNDLTGIYLNHVVDKVGAIHRLYPKSKQIHINSKVTSKTQVLTGNNKITYSLFCYNDFEYMEPGEVYSLSPFAITSEVYDTFSDNYIIRQMHNKYCRYYEFESRGYTPDFKIEDYSISNQSIFDQYYIKEEQYKLDILVSRIYGTSIQYRVDILCDNQVYTIDNVSQFVRLSSNLYILVFSNTDMVTTYDDEVVVNRCNVFYFDTINARRCFRPLTLLNKLKISSIMDFNSIDLTSASFDAYIYFKQVKDMIFDVKRNQWLNLVVAGLDVMLLDIQQINNNDFIINGRMYSCKYISEDSVMYLRPTSLNNITVLDKGPCYTVDGIFYSGQSSSNNNGYEFIHKTSARFHSSEIPCYFVKIENKIYVVYMLYGQLILSPVSISIDLCSKVDVVLSDEIIVEKEYNYVKVNIVFMSKRDGFTTVSSNTIPPQPFKDVVYNTTINGYIVRSINPPNNYSYLENITTPISSTAKFTDLEALFNYLQVPLLTHNEKTIQNTKEELRIKNEIRHMEKKYNIVVTEENGKFIINPINKK